MIDPYFFPGFTRKAVTFTIDDGNVVYDKKFIDIVRPYGIRGTFNLCGTEKLTPDEYRELYRGFEIANHVKHHPMVFVPGKSYPLTDEIFDIAVADPAKLYRHPENRDVYILHGSFLNPKLYTDRTRSWFRITDPETYVSLIDRTDEELRAVFGEGSVRSFVWPFGRQVDDQRILEHVKRLGYYGARSAGEIAEFELPKNRMAWSYGARHSTLLSMMERFDGAEDDGKLKIFAFGVHSVDYENSDRWGDLRTFCEKYGKREKDFYYATVGEIFDYEDAIKQLSISDGKIHNGSSLPLYVKIRGKETVIQPSETIDVCC